MKYKEMNMITEKEIIQILKEYHERLVSLSGRIEKQEQEYEKRGQFLQGVFQRDPELILSLFWKYYKEWLQLSEKDRIKNPRYSDVFFWAVIDSKGPEAIELACQMLAKSDDLYKEYSAQFLGDAKASVAVPCLIEALNSEDYSVVSKAAIALGEIGGTRAESHLLRIVEKYNNDRIYSEDRIDDAYPIIRYNAFIALCLLNTPLAQQKILQSLFYDRDKGIQLRAIRYLVAEMPTEAIHYLKELCKHDDKEIAILAEGYLKELNSKC